MTVADKINKVYNALINRINEKINTHNSDSSAHSTEMSKKLNKAQGSSNASKNVVTDSGGNITLETKVTKTSQLTNDGDGTNVFVKNNDSRLSDARTPTSHTHGDITNDGKLGSTANKPLITTTSGKITTGSFGTSANTFCQGNDSRLSDARTPTSHTHTKSQITDFPTIPTKTSDLTNDADGTTGVTYVKSNDSRLTNARTPTSHTHTKSQITDFPTLSTVATSGSYNDLSNKPSIPTKTSDLTNDADGTSGVTYVKSNDSRLTDARTPTTHTHTKSQITDFPNIPSASSITPSADTTNGAIGSSSNYAKADHQHPLSSAYATNGHTHTGMLTSSDVEFVEVLVEYTDGTSETLNLVLDANGGGQIVDSVILTYDNINFIVNVYDSNGNGVSNKTVAIYRNQYQDGSGNYNYDFDVTTDNNGSVTFENPHQQYSYFKAICDGVESNIATDTIETPPIDDL